MQHAVNVIGEKAENAHFCSPSCANTPDNVVPTFPVRQLFVTGAEPAGIVHLTFAHNVVDPVNRHRSSVVAPTGREVSLTMAKIAVAGNTSRVVAMWMIVFMGL
jgi:hypothetical protein